MYAWVTFCLSVHLLMSTELFPPSGYCKYCSEHWCTSICFLFAWVYAQEWTCWALRIILYCTSQEPRVRPYIFGPFLDISEIGRSAKSYCEHTARTQPTLSDIVVTLVEMGEYISTFPFFCATELESGEKEGSPGMSHICRVFLSSLVRLLVCS